MFRKRLTCLMLVSFLDERAACFRNKTSGYSFWMLNDMGLLVKGGCLPWSKISWTDMLRTVELSVSWMKEEIWQWGALQSGAFRLAKFRGKLTFPARYWRLTCYLLTVVRRSHEGWQKPLLGKACWHPGHKVDCRSRHMSSVLPG